MLSSAAHDTPPFSWDNRPQLIAFEFEGSLNGSAVATATLSQSSNGRLACLRPIPATWFATDCTPDVQTLQARKIEIAAFNNDSKAYQSTLACLRASTVVDGLRSFSAAGSVSSSFKYSLLDSASDLWPFATDGGMVMVPFGVSDPVGIMTALAKSYDGPRRPVVISLSNMIQSIGQAATTIIVQEIMSLPDIVAVTTGQIAALIKAKNAAEAESIVNLCREPSPTTTTAPTTVPVQTRTPAPPSTTQSPKPTAPTSAGSGTIAPTSRPTTAPSGSQGPVTVTPSPTLATKLPAIPTSSPISVSPTTSTSTTAPTSAPVVTNTPTTPVRRDPGGNLTSIPLTTTPEPTSDTKANATVPTMDPMTSAPPATFATTSPLTPIPNTFNNPPTSDPNLVDNVQDQPGSGSHSDSSSSSKSTGYVPYVIGIGGGLCAMAVAIVYKVFKREDRFPPVITNGYVFDAEDRGIYDLEAHDGSVRVGAESGEGSSSFIQSDLESVSSMA